MNKTVLLIFLIFISNGCNSTDERIIEGEYERKEIVEKNVNRCLQSGVISRRNGDLDSLLMVMNKQPDIYLPYIKKRIYESFDNAEKEMNFSHIHQIPNLISVALLVFPEEMLIEISLETLQKIRTKIKNNDEGDYHYNRAMNFIFANYHRKVVDRKIIDFAFKELEIRSPLEIGPIYVLFLDSNYRNKIKTMKRLEMKVKQKEFFGEKEHFYKLFGKYL